MPGNGGLIRVSFSWTAAASRRLWGFCLLGLSCAVLFSAASAHAASSHAPSRNFGAPGPGAGELALAAGSGVAVNATTHDVYVADTGNHRIDEFAADGSFVRAWGWGVADGIGAACAAAAAAATAQDRILVFGSFHTVGPALDYLDAQGLLP